MKIKNIQILNQNAKRYEARNTECEARRPLGRAPQARSFLRAKRAARDENVRAKRADFFFPCTCG